jgi:hypothetical protein
MVISPWDLARLLKRIVKTTPRRRRAGRLPRLISVFPAARRPGARQGSSVKPDDTRGAA